MRSILEPANGRGASRQVRINSPARVSRVRIAVSIDELVDQLGDWIEGDSPLYVQLATRVGKLIESGSLPGGSFLPSERAIARGLSVSRRTVEAALESLRARALIDRRTGVGTWCTSGRSISRQPLAKRTPHEVVAQHIMRNESQPLDLTLAVVSAHSYVAKARLAATSLLGSLYRGSGYIPAGLDVLREQISGWFCEYGVPTTPGQVLVTSGATQALWLAAGLLGRGSPVYVENPTSVTILNALRSYPLQLRGVQVDDFGMHVGAVPVTGALTVFVTPPYQTPTGALLSESRCRTLAMLAAEHGVLVVEDLTLADLRFTGVRPTMVAASAPDAPILSIGSASKLFWGGLRVGWIRGPAELINQMARIKTALDFGPAVDVQAQVAWLLEHRNPALRDRAVQLRRQRDALDAALRTALPSWSWRLPGGGLSLWVTLPEQNAEQIRQQALRSGIGLLTGRAFDVHGTDNCHLRVPFTYPPELGRVVAERLATAVSDSRPGRGIRS